MGLLGDINAIFVWVELIGKILIFIIGVALIAYLSQYLMTAPKMIQVLAFLAIFSLVIGVFMNWFLGLTIVCMQGKMWSGTMVDAGSLKSQADTSGVNFYNGQTHGTILGPISDLVSGESGFDEVIAAPLTHGKFVGELGTEALLSGRTIKHWDAAKSVETVQKKHTYLFTIVKMTDDAYFEGNRYVNGSCYLFEDPYFSGLENFEEQGWITFKYIVATKNSPTIEVQSGTENTILGFDFFATSELDLSQCENVSSSQLYLEGESGKGGYVFAQYVKIVSSLPTKSSREIQFEKMKSEGSTMKQVSVSDFKGDILQYGCSKDGHDTIVKPYGLDILNIQSLFFLMVAFGTLYFLKWMGVF
jgi:hypothetical protein